ncbi:heterochromatin protein 1-binding protein 3 [Arapaima gigas]
MARNKECHPISQSCQVCTMPVRRAAPRTSQETPPKATPEGEEPNPPPAEPSASSEESASTGEEQEVPPAAPAQEEKGEGVVDNMKAAETEDKTEEKQVEDGNEVEKREKEKDTGKEKEKGKKVKKTIPAWATMSFSKRTTTVSLYNQPKVDDIVIEAIQACKDKSGASTYAIRNYIVKKYASLELDKKKFLIRKALKRLVEKGVVKQLKGKGFSGSFTVGRQSPKSGNQVGGDNDDCGGVCIKLECYCGYMVVIVNMKNCIIV